MKMSDGLNGISNTVALVNAQPVNVNVVPSAVASITAMNNISAAAGGALNCTSLSPTSMANLATVVNNHVNASNANVVTTNGANHHHHLNNLNTMNMNINSQQNTQNMADYLAQLIKDKKQLAIFPNLFLHLDRILDEEISRVRGNLFHLSGTKVEPLELPEPVGPVVTSSEKVYVPVKEHPDFNFVGRILGPRGMTAKQLEQETGCKIMVRGKGSMRDKKKEEQNRGKPNWEHLNDELHVLITVEDTDNRAKIKLQRAVDEVKKLLIPAEGEDELKKRQLMELAIINGTYRDSKESRAQAAVSAAAAQLVSPQVPLSALRTNLGFHYGFLKHKNMMESLHSSPYLGQLDQQTHLVNFDGLAGNVTGLNGLNGCPLIISPHRLSNGLSNAAAAASGHQQLLAQGGDSLLYATSPSYADYATYLQLAEYPPEHVGKMSGVRRLTGLRDNLHPYLPKTDPSASILH